MHTTSKEKNGQHGPQKLISGNFISKHASYSAVFSLFHSNISKKKQHEKHLCNPSSQYGKYGRPFMKHAPHTLIQQLS